ncbi:MAG: N-acetylmuramoyl-L-alanine amidase, partial [Clostridia bacterium]|nr:N-acetylmuramoyl-L-alanine amidase [Clostridia bacterium]
MVFSVKSTRLVAILLVVLALQAGLTFFLCMRQLSQDVSLIDYTIVVDAGHGGMDGGKVATDGTKESDLNLKYAKTLGKMLTDSGFN